MDASYRAGSALATAALPYLGHGATKVAISFDNGAGEQDPRLGREATIKGDQSGLPVICGNHP